MKVFKKIIIFLVLNFIIFSCAFSDEISGLSLYDDAHVALTKYFKDVDIEKFKTYEIVADATATSRTFKIEFPDTAKIEGRKYFFTGELIFKFKEEEVTVKKDQKEKKKFFDVEIDFNSEAKVPSKPLFEGMNPPAEAKVVKVKISAYENGFIYNGLTTVHMENENSIVLYINIANMRGFWFYPKYPKEFNPYPPA